MKILIVGSGGREHALAWKIAQSPKTEKLFCAPGNGGISALAECVPIKAAEVKGIVDFSVENKIDMVVVAPEDPLAMGMVDELEKAGIRAFGPNRVAAAMESSKIFAKDFMRKYGIPTASYRTFDSPGEAVSYLKDQNYPVFIKADGLAKGKGAVMCRNRDEAVETVKEMMENQIFGVAGARIVIEECLAGREVTVLSFTDGKTLVPMASSQDHKRVFDNDMGLNTGGMGAITPSRIYTPEIADECMRSIFIPTVEGMKKEGIKFKGCLYFGLMLTEDGPKVIEYNARFGDPETQVVLPMLKTDLVEIMDAVIDERLDRLNIEWDAGAAVCVVMASGGYPEKYETGYEITGIKDAEGLGCMVFHAGTEARDGKTVTAGGRVLGVTSTGRNLDEAIEKAYAGVSRIHFKDMHYRRDIGINLLP